jgi:hypothetical protein
MIDESSYFHIPIPVRKAGANNEQRLFIHHPDSQDWHSIAD